jgi:hypothetical protein
MMPSRFSCGLFIGAALMSFPVARAQNVDAAFQRFWSAKSPKEAAQVADDIIKSGIAFDGVLRRLKAGRTYAPQSSGVIQLSNRTADGFEHHYAVNIPAAYDPARRYQVRFQLHGGVGGRTDNQPRGNGEIGALAGAEQIYVLPYAWQDAPWWSDDQVLNLGAIVDALKRTYNIDENRVVLSGVSDGATGAYYIAMRDTTPFASFLPLNGFIMVLANSEIDDGRIFPNNLRNKPLFVVNGGRDPLYPTATVEPYTRQLMASGVGIDYHPQPDGEHNTRWWPQVKDMFEKFVTDHPRDPDPDKLTWQTADVATHNRAHWLVIDRLGGAPSESDVKLFDEAKNAGRVDLVRNGNTVRASTKGVAAFTLLLSPDKFDFDQPIKVMANGREIFNARVPRSVKTLMAWAARDNDRTMLYGAELTLKLMDR